MSGSLIRIKMILIAWLCILVTSAHAFFRYGHFLPGQAIMKTKDIPPSKFLGILGPSMKPDQANRSSLMHFLMSPGVLQGVFVRANRTTSPLIQLPVGNFRNQANTALLSFGKRLYALYERGSPRELHVDWVNETVSVGSDIGSAGFVSGHAKRRGSDLVSLRYSVWDSTVSITVFDPSWGLNKEVCVDIEQGGPAWWMPIVHDFVLIGPDQVLFPCSPFRLSWTGLSLADSGGVRFYLVNTTSGEYRLWEDGVSTYYVFHFAPPNMGRRTGYSTGGKGTPSSTIRLQCAVYEDLAFGGSALGLKGRWREMTLLPSGGLITHGWNQDLEEMNLDFPVEGPDGVVCLRRVSEENVVNELVFVLGLKIVGRKRMKGRFLCAEPVWDPDRSMWMGLSWNCKDPTEVYLWKLAWPALAYKEEVIETGNKTLTLGFHSGLVARL